MTDEELRNALDGLHAYDEGATDSGIRDENLRERCQKALAERRDQGASAWGKWISRLIRDMWLSDEAIAQGYGWWDARDFADWLEDRMKCPLS